MAFTKLDYYVEMHENKITQIKTKGQRIVALNM